MITTQRILVLFLLLMLGACGDEPAEQDSGSSEPADEARTEASAETRTEPKAWRLIADGAVVIDVRSKTEFEQGHLEQAQLMPHDQIADLIKQSDIPQDQQIVLYCRSGNRAGKAQETLERLGYQLVLNAGGYETLMKYKPQE